MKIKTDKSADWKIYWQAFRKGDMNAFHRIYVSFFDRLYAYGSKLINDNALLEDCIHELFLQLYTKRDNLSETENLEYYLLKTLKFIIYQRNRKRSKLVLSGLNERSSEPSGFVFVQEQKTEEEAEDDDKLKHIMQALSSSQRELLYLKFHQNLSYKEIGQILGVQPDSAKKQVYRIVARLKKMNLEILLLLFSFRSLCITWHHLICEGRFS